jgi:hypothetical protein
MRFKPLTLKLSLFGDYEIARVRFIFSSSAMGKEAASDRLVARSII